MCRNLLLCRYILWAINVWVALVLFFALLSPLLLSSAWLCYFLPHPFPFMFKFSYDNLHSHLDRILNHLGDTPLDGSVRVFPERFIWGRKTSWAWMGSTIPTVWVLNLINRVLINRVKGESELSQQHQPLFSYNRHHVSVWPAASPAQTTLPDAPCQTVTLAYEPKQTFLKFPLSVILPQQREMSLMYAKLARPLNFSWPPQLKELPVSIGGLW